MLEKCHEILNEKRKMQNATYRKKSNYDRKRPNVYNGKKKNYWTEKVLKIRQKPLAS